jgi:hypothetical protein
MPPPGFRRAGRPTAQGSPVLPTLNTYGAGRPRRSSLALNQRWGERPRDAPGYKLVFDKADGTSVLVASLNQS